MLGQNNSHYEAVHLAIEDVTFNIELKRNVKNMPELMAWADVAISAAGTTCWELAFMGLPSLVIAVADNQRPVAESFEAVGAARSLGWHEDLANDEVSNILSGLLRDPNKREDMARMGGKLVDGGGVDRVTRLLQNNEIRLRAVREDDCQLLWKWANEPDVRAASFSSEPISWEEHVQWFKSKMKDPNCAIFLGINCQGTPVGQARFDKKGSEALISISIDKEFRGRGYGSSLIKLGSQKIFEVFDVCKIHSYAKIENQLSKGAFVKAGYKEIGVTKIQGHPSLHLSLTK